MKIIKRAVIAILAMPFLLILLLILYELFGMAVNHAATSWQTKMLKQDITSMYSHAEILSEYSRTGNTSGTGNHVDMETTLIVYLEESAERVEAELNEKYGGKTYRWISVLSLDEAIQDHADNPWCYECLNKMAVPKSSEDCLLIVLNRSAPFVNNIEGH